MGRTSLYCLEDRILERFGKVGMHGADFVTLLIVLTNILLHVREAVIVPLQE
jgi:hypothetical protein